MLKNFFFPEIEGYGEEYDTVAFWFQQDGTYTSHPTTFLEFLLFFFGYISNPILTKIDEEP